MTRLNLPGFTASRRLQRNRWLRVIAGVAFIGSVFTGMIAVLSFESLAVALYAGMGVILAGWALIHLELDRAAMYERQLRSTWRCTACGTIVRKVGAEFVDGECPKRAGTCPLEHVA